MKIYIVIYVDKNNEETYNKLVTVNRKTVIEFLKPVNPIYTAGQCWEIEVWENDKLIDYHYIRNMEDVENLQL